METLKTKWSRELKNPCDVWRMQSQDGRKGWAVVCPNGCGEVFLLEQKADDLCSNDLQCDLTRFDPVHFPCCDVSYWLHAGEFSPISTTPYQSMI